MTEPHKLAEAKMSDWDVELQAKARNYAQAVREGVVARWSFPDTPNELRFGREMLASLIEELAQRYVEVLSALLISEEWATGNIDDPGHPDHRAIMKALRREGYAE